MIPYDEVDKSNWVNVDIDWDEETVKYFTDFADKENRSLSEWVSKVLYEWWQKLLESGEWSDNPVEQLVIPKEHYDKTENEIVE
jgi:hypothetical protein